MVHEAAEKCQKKVSGPIFPKKHLFRKMGRGGGVFNIALVPLQDEQLAVDLAIYGQVQGYLSIITDKSGVFMLFCHSELDSGRQAC